MNSFISPLNFQRRRVALSRKKNKYFKNVQSLADLQKQLNKMYHLYSHKL